MATVERADRTSPPLENGDRLSVEEFPRRHEMMPDLKKAELIEGVVYTGSPVSIRRHSMPHFNLIGWLSFYQSETPGVEGGDIGSIRLDLDNMPQPDAFLMIQAESGGQARIDDEDYLAGEPEHAAFVAKPAASTREGRT